jgi:hypothetical protein
MAAQKIIFNTDVNTTTGGLTLAGDKLGVAVDGTTIVFDGAGKLKSNIASVAVSATAAVTSGHEIGSVTVDSTTTTFKETVIGVAAATTPGVKGYTITKEDGTPTNIAASGFISAEAGNSVVIDPTDGGIYFSATAQLPDDQVLTGDNTGGVSITLTPTTTGTGATAQTDYAIKADLKIAATTPAATENTNLLKKNGSQESYVDMQDIATALGMTIALNTTAMKLELKRGATVVSSVNVQDFTDIGGTAGTFYMLKA